MPLNTQIIRDGKPLKLKWGAFHVTAMVMAASWDSGEGPFENNAYPDYTEPMPISSSDTFFIPAYHNIAMTPLNRGEYKLNNPHSFIDMVDGEILELKPGDILSVWRS